MWTATLVLVCLLKLCAGAATVPSWWTNAVYYRIIVDSFRDSDGDGLGDIKGVARQISYVRALGADAIILSSIADKSTDCSKPGIVDHALIDKRYGTLESFNALLDKAKTLELKVIVTLQLQTLSEQSEWFKSSVKRVNGYDDWFLWKEGKPDDPPQAEVSVDSWMWSEERVAYFGSSNNEAKLNLCSEGVSAALSAAQCAWLRRGVNGILLNPDFAQDQTCGEKLLRKLAAEALSCARAANLDTPVVLVETSLSPDKAANYYGDIGGNSVFNQALASTVRRTAPEIALEFHAALLNAPQDSLPTWITSSMNGSRISTRHGNEMVDAITLLALTLPGAAVIQQGDELGAADTILEWASSTNTCWPNAAAASAAPFPWDDSIKAGFTTGEPWLPLSPNYRYANAKAEFANDLSHVGVVRVAAAMRKSPAIGPHAEIKRLGDAISILRWGGTGSLLLVSNVAKVPTEAEVSRIPGLPAQMTVAASSAGSSMSSGSHVNIEKPLKLMAGETVLLAGAPRHCGGPGPVDKIANKLSEGWQKINKYFSNA